MVSSGSIITPASRRVVKKCASGRGARLGERGPRVLLHESLQLCDAFLKGLREAFALVDAGVCDAETVDRVVKQSFGLRLPVLGPAENADLIGLDLTLAVHDYILPHLDRTPGPAAVLRDHVKNGELGMKTGRGFREWTADEAQAVRERLLDHLVQATRATDDHTRKERQLR